MLNIKQTEAFRIWLAAIKGGPSQRRLLARLRKASFGLMGDVQPVGEGVMEMREHFGPGWRMYFTQRGQQIIVMLGGGSKSSQQADMRAAIRLAKELED